MIIQTTVENYSEVTIYTNSEGWGVMSFTKMEAISLGNGDGTVGSSLSSLVESRALASGFNCL
jgi:hypothetical protein